MTHAGDQYGTLHVADDLRAGLDALRGEVLTDLASIDDIRQYQRTALERSPDPAPLLAQFQMRAETVELAAGASYERYRPVGSAASRGIIVFVHGGGLIAGSRFDGVEVALEPAAALGLEVWSVEYGIAPDTAFSRAVDTCVSVVDAALAAGVGPVVIAGQSAGGGLAAAAAQLVRDRTAADADENASDQAGELLIGQLLVCPMLDDRSETASMRQFESDPSWSRISNITAWRAALAGDGGETAQVPGRAQSLAGLPQTFLDTGSAEVFRDDIVSYAAGLWAAGVPTELHVWEGGFHAFDCVVPEAEVSRAARAARTTWLQRVFAAA